MQTTELVNKFLSNRQAKNLSQVSLEWYKRALMRFAEAFPKLPKSPEEIEAFLAGFDRSDETRHAYYRALRALYRFGNQRCQVPDVIEKVSPPQRAKKIMPTCEPKEIMVMLQSAHKSASSARDSALLTLLIDNGVRASEAAGLRHTDIHAETIRVDGKTGEREVPISEEARRQLLNLNSDKSEYVFLGCGGRPLTRSGVYRIVRRYMTEAGISGPKRGAHRLRHSFAKQYLVNGGDLRSLQLLMGHKHITTTEKYASLSIQDTIAKHRQFSPLKSAQAATQQSLFDPAEAIKEAEEIISQRKGQNENKKQKGVSVS